MRGYDYFLRLVVFIGLVLFGMLVTALVSALILMSSGISMADIMKMSEEGMDSLSAGLIRALLAAQHLFVFILPGLAFGFIFFRSKILQGFQISKSPGIMYAVLGILFLIASYPLVNLSFMLNEAMPLPAWAADFENQAEDTLKKVLEMHSPLIFVFNLLLIAFLPGIGEELIFRGIIQKQLGGFLKNPIAAIWISAFIFSAIHMQFEGFFPRIVLGATLGYLYYWTGNLWVPMIAHAFNNGIQIVLIYVTGMDLSEFDEKGSSQLQWWMIPLSVGAMYLIYNSILKKRTAIE
ncbi:MAG TPA: type II CAAX endopeptidase family protein [Saprospiraceae bacterium]|nr:type II CAAX endopeptidase family protein [Saprospiraceae bacterium]